MCSFHLRSLRNEDYDKFVFNEEYHNWIQPAPDTLISTPTFDADEMISNYGGSLYEPLHDGESKIDSDDDDECNSLSSFVLKDTSTKEVSRVFNYRICINFLFSQYVRAMRIILSYHQITRLKSEKKWDKLKPDTRRKKVGTSVWTRFHLILR